MSLHLIRKLENGDLKLDGVPVHIRGTVTQKSNLPVSDNDIGAGYFVGNDMLGLWNGSQWIYYESISMSDMQSIANTAVDNAAPNYATAAQGALADTALQAETDPFYAAEKPLLALKSELPDISGLATQTEVQAVAELVSGKLDANAQAADSAMLGGRLPEEYATTEQMEQHAPPTPMLDLHVSLDSSTPTNSIVFRPTAATFEGLSMMSFSVPESEFDVIVIFSSFNVFETLGLDPPEVVDDCQGMWVLLAETIEEERVVTQALHVTDGTNILIPAVHLSEWCGEHEMVLIQVIQINSTIFHGSGLDGSESPIVTAIDGCDFFFRMSVTQAIEHLWNKTLTMTQTQYESLSEPDINAIPIGTSIDIIE